MAFKVLLRNSCFLWKTGNLYKPDSLLYIDENQHLANVETIVVQTVPNVFQLNKQVLGQLRPRKIALQPQKR